MLTAKELGKSTNSVSSVGVVNPVGHVPITQLSEYFEISQKEQFTGRLLAYTQTGQQWSLYFFMGRLIWGAGGNHRFRRWFRLLSVHLASFDRHQLPAPSPSHTYLWEYALLSMLLQQKKVSKQSVNNLIYDSIGEVLFEILQEATGIKQANQSMEQVKKLGDPAVMLKPDRLLGTAKDEWDQWCQNGLTAHSPNLSPILKASESLQQKIPESSYAKLSILLTGERSLREIATHLKIDSLSLTKSLISFVHQGIIALDAIPDWQPQTTEKRKNERNDEVSLASKPSSSQPLILCIDDSPSICQALETIIKAKGYRFISVQDSLQALPTMLEYKPDLILLDLVMPVASGYEICAQIRRIESFKTIPVIILTGKDGMVDRVRAKLVGASDFLSKPVQPSRVLTAISQYLIPRYQGNGNKLSTLD